MHQLSFLSAAAAVALAVPAFSSAAEAQPSYPMTAMDFSGFTVTDTDCEALVGKPSDFSGHLVTEENCVEMYAGNFNGQIVGEGFCYSA